jgi:basic membrane protein A
VTSFLPQPKCPRTSCSSIWVISAPPTERVPGGVDLGAKQAVGFVGGEDDPTQQRIQKALSPAPATRSGIQGLGIITGDYDNAAKGREAAATLIGNGADVIWHAADVTGLGAIQGAVAGKAKVLGCYSDQTNLAPNNMATSFEMNLGGMVQTVAHAVANHSFAGGTEWKPTVDWMWLLKAGAHGDHNPQLVSPAAWAAFQKMERSFAATLGLKSRIERPLVSA